MIYLTLFLSFFKIGLFTFGGGYAMLPMLMRTAADKKHWVTREELENLYAVGQVTPGLIAVNTATFVGIKQKGILGGVVSTLGIIFPSIIIITLVAILAENFYENETVKSALQGVRLAVCALITVVISNMLKSSIKHTPKNHNSNDKVLSKNYNSHDKNTLKNYNLNDKNTPKNYNLNDKNISNIYNSDINLIPDNHQSDIIVVEPLYEKASTLEEQLDNSSDKDKCSNHGLSRLRNTVASLAIFAVAFTATGVFGISPVSVVLVAVLFAAVLTLGRRRRRRL